MKCPKCQVENPETSLFCPGCGAKLDAAKDLSLFQMGRLPREGIFMNGKALSRRDFMKSSAAGIAGFMCLPPHRTKQDKNPRERKFIYRTLGKSGIRVPVIGMGMLLSDQADLMRAALDAGITHFDTTAGQPQQVRNEVMIGEVLKGRPRGSFIFGPKIHLPQNQTTGLYEKGATEQEFLKKMDASLKRLQMDYVDILYHHDVSRRESALYEPIMKAMDRAKREGKTRFLGLTTHMNVAEAVQAAADSNFYEVVMAAYNFRQKDQLKIKEAIAKAAGAGLGVVAIKIIRGGYDEYDKPTNPAASLKWVLQNPNVHATIPGFSTFEEMNVDLSVMEDLTLTDTEKEDLRRASLLPGLYCQGCGRCLKQCPAGLPIPDLMRAYMYAYGYRQPALARSLVASLELPGRICEDCCSCAVKCLNGWNIAGKIQDAASFQTQSAL
jgi:predicted aldo/keto reductase-like oxidoreductase